VSKPFVLVCTPMHGSPVPAYTPALMATCKLLDAQYLTYSSPLVGLARNTLVSQFVSRGADVLLFVDADEAWEAEDARALVYAAMALDFVGAPVARKKRDWAEVLRESASYGITPQELSEEGLEYNFHFRSEDVSEHGYDGPVKLVGDRTFLRVASVGTGLLALSSDGLERVRRSAIVKGYGSRDFELFPTGPKGDKYLGEDRGFMSLLAELGEEVWMEPEIKVEHFGLTAFSGTPDVNLLAREAHRDLPR
jgi:hypothetical protein